MKWRKILLCLTVVVMLAIQTPAPMVAQEGNMYEDPEGRFSMPLVGDWTQLETDGTYALFEVTGFDLNMYVVAVEADDPEAGADAALRQIDIDPATLTQTRTDLLGPWDVFFYSVDGEEGVSVLAQTKDGVTYYLIFTGELYLTEHPPDQVMKSFDGFTLAGEEVVLPATVGQFEAYINSFVGEVPAGLSIAIALGNDILYAQGFGMADGPKGMAATPDTVYQWSSVTKIATATAIVQLYDQGLLDLDAPVSDYLDYFPAEYPITVRQLLTHSAALPDPGGFVPLNLNLDGKPLPDPDGLARKYYEEFTGLMFEPGSASRYSNLDYMTLGQIVAEVSGQPYVEYVQEHLLGPLGMESTDFTHSSEAMIANAAAGAFPAAEAEALIAMLDEIRGLGDGADFIRETDDRHAWMSLFNVPASSGGGLLGPVTEAIRFGQMHLNGGELDGVRIMSPESVALMQEMQLSTSGAPLGYGLGWDVFDGGERTFIEHNGDGTGSAAKLRLYPDEGLAIVMMSNSNRWDRATVADAAANVVFLMTAE